MLFCSQSQLLFVNVKLKLIADIWLQTGDDRADSSAKQSDELPLRVEVIIVSLKTSLHTSLQAFVTAEDVYQKRVK